MSLLLLSIHILLLLLELPMGKVLDSVARSAFDKLVCLQLMAQRE